jgi:hypothetical protein
MMYSVSKSRNKKDVSKVLCDVFNFINPDNHMNSFILSLCMDVWVFLQAYCLTCIWLQ